MYRGKCLCGRIQFSLCGEPTDPHVCCCQMCQHWSGAPLVAWVNFPLASILHEGEQPTLYRSSHHTQRGFCSQCGSTLFALDDGSDTICMTMAVLDEKDNLFPEFESFSEHAPTWLSCSLKHKEYPE